MPDEFHCRDEIQNHLRMFVREIYKLYSSTVWKTWLLLFVLLGGSPLLGQEGVITGVIVDQDGHPVVGALVGVLDQAVAGMKDTKTDTEGKFKVEGLSDKALFRIVVTKYGYGQASIADVQPSGTEEIRVQLKRDAAVLSQPAPQAPPLTDRKAENTSQTDQSEFTLSVNVQEVLLNISVEDAAGRPIPDLGKERFTILQDGEAQEIKYFGHENVPISAVLLVDVSSSMEGSPLVEAKVASLAFLDEMNAADAISLVSFNDKVVEVRPFTQDLLKVRTGVHSLEPRGGTALYDALGRAVGLMQSAPHPRHVIVLLSDGKDEDSLSRFSALDHRIQSSDVVLYSIGEYADIDRKLFIGRKKYYKPPEVETNLNPVWVLEYLADLSGGRAFFPKLGEPLGPFFSRIVQDLRQQYVITYEPTATQGKDNFHSIEVKVNSSEHPGLKIRTRKGYLADKP